MSNKNTIPEQCKAALSEALQPDFFKALCDPTRISIVATLAANDVPVTVSEIADCCGIDFSGVSRHLKILKDAGILSAERDGRSVSYQLDSDALAHSLRNIADALDICRNTASSSVR